MMPSTLGELRIDKQPRQHPGKVVAGRATCEEALETPWTPSVLCSQPCYTCNYGQVVLYSSIAHLYVVSKLRKSSELSSMSGTPDPPTFVYYFYNGNAPSLAVLVPVLCLRTTSASRPWLESHHVYRSSASCRPRRSVNQERQPTSIA
jgi:hypothetical protein